MPEEKLINFINEEKKMERDEVYSYRLSILYMVYMLSNDLFENKKYKIKKNNELNIITLHIFTVIFMDIESVLFLSKDKDGHSTAIALIARTVFESTARLYYLWLCKELGDDNARRKWFTYDEVQKKKLSEKWEILQKNRKDENKEPFVPSKLFKIDNTAKKHIEKSDLPDLYTMCSKIDKVLHNKKRFKMIDIEFRDTSFVKDYILGYYYLSSFTHANARAGHSCIVREESCKYFDISYAKQINIPEYLAFISNYYLLMVSLIAHINHTKPDIYEKFILDTRLIKENYKISDLTK